MSAATASTIVFISIVSPYLLLFALNKLLIVLGKASTVCPFGVSLKATSVVQFFMSLASGVVVGVKVRRTRSPALPTTTGE